MEKNRPTVGLALSGAGNRSSFYIGFLEVLDENNINLDYIVAMSGASLVSAAYACKTMPAFKEKILALDSKGVKALLSKGREGGLYSLDGLEKELKLNYTKGFTFDEVRPLLSFVAADIHTGEIVDLCIGDIAKAACASCTLPGVFSPVEWGNRTLVDGGILSQVPVTSLKKFGPDVTIGVNMRGTKNIFSSKLITFKKVLNFFRKIFFIGKLETFIDQFIGDDEDQKRDLGLFAVLGKSLDVVIKAIKNGESEPEDADLMIIPELIHPNKSEFSPKTSQFYYKAGREVALDNLHLIRQVIKKKAEAQEKETILA
jgi:predicted acylesterase/phospholipase RssA